MNHRFPRLRCFKEYCGVLLFDSWRYERAFRRLNSNDWLELCNRNETIQLAADGKGVQCIWRWSSELHAPKFVRKWGRRLMERALGVYPITIEEPANSVVLQENPEITFIIGHRGSERLPLLLLTLKSIANQQGASCECIVVEESYKPEIQDKLPGWVRYLHLGTESTDQPYNRSRTFNEGARLAKSTLLVFHDNDMLVPQNYAAELLKQSTAGYQVMNLKRFIFYLSELDTLEIIKSGKLSVNTPDFCLQNLTGGGSLAVEITAFTEIGGFDEGFVGWGGEDVEFWDRAQLLKVNNFGYLPIVHLWHTPQPEKNKCKDSPAMRRLDEVLSMDAKSRIEALVSGKTEQPGDRVVRQIEQ